MLLQFLDIWLYQGDGTGEEMLLCCRDEARQMQERYQEAESERVCYSQIRRVIPNSAATASQEDLLEKAPDQGHLLIAPAAGSDAY